MSSAKIVTTGEHRTSSWIIRHGWQIIVALIAFGAAARGFEMTLMQKVDRAELAALAYKVERIEPFASRATTTDSLLRQILLVQREQATELRTVRALLCDRNTSDSWCRR